MPFLIFFLVISLPVIEVASIVEAGRLIGPFATFLLLTAGVAFGAFLIRTQSMSIGRRAYEAMQAGTPPEQTMLDSAAVIFAGLLFIIPGFFTDLLALFLLLPTARRLIWRGVSFGMRGSGSTMRTRTRVWTEPPQPPRRSEEVIDVEFTEVPRDSDNGDGGGRKDSPWGKP
jgi:UPF0716 protein FxsA